MSHLPYDARAILAYLNELGYRNISAEQLREFMKDLRKLIKYEERLGNNAQSENYFEGLFRRTTASYRAKVDKENVVQKDAAAVLGRKSQRKALSEQNQNVLHEKPTDKKQPLSLHQNANVSAQPATGIRRTQARTNNDAAWERQAGAWSSRNRAGSTGRSRAASPKSAQSKAARDQMPRSQSSERTNTAGSGSVLIPKQRPKYGNKRPGNSDPVKLYHYYQREWKHFQNQIPGEKTRADVRWQVRQKLLDPN